MSLITNVETGVHSCDSKQSSIGDERNKNTNIKKKELKQKC